MYPSSGQFCKNDNSILLKQTSLFANIHLANLNLKVSSRKCMSKMNIFTLLGFLFGLVMVSLSMGGCAMATGAKEMHPSARYADLRRKTATEIMVYNANSGDIPPSIRVANLGAHGNGYANDQVLIQKLKEEAAAIGADMVVVYHKEITKDETIGTYGGGMFIADQIQRPHMYGVAYVYAKSTIGIRFDNNRKILYVVSGSGADKVGIKEGMTLLAVNGEFVNDISVFEKNVFSKNPGENISLEILNLDGIKEIFTVALQPVK